MNFHEIVYSVAGRKSVQARDLLDGLNDAHLLPNEKAVIKALVASFDKSKRFHSLKYLCSKFGAHEPSCNNISDIQTELIELLSGRLMQDTTMGIQEAIADSSDVKELQDNISKVMEGTPSTDIDIVDHRQTLEKDYVASKNLKNSFSTGIPVLDEKTGGYGEGLVASVIAWTSHGKSAFWMNAIYKNMQAGKKIALISLEIPAYIAHYQLLSRTSYDMEIKVPYTQIIRRTISDDVQNYIFRDVLGKINDLPGDIRILESGAFNKWDEAEISRVLRRAEEAMDGLDYVIVDHVNLFRYIDSKVEGDFYVKNFQQISMNYRTRKNGMIGVGFAVQANRQGWKAAKANEGRYDLLAISEFREVERASTYVTFIYADETMRIQGEAKIHLQKHRIGAIMEEPEITRVQYPYSVFGLDHKGTKVTTRQGMTDDLFQTTKIPTAARIVQNHSSSAASFTDPFDLE